MRKKKKKVLLIGWDAADWKVINPLIDAGKMPALERMINNGVMGDIATLEPALSPMLWTSIGTGMLADKHGIYGFTEPDIASGSVKPISVTSRKVKAIWNILTQNGYKTNLVGWWPSNPAEPINGVNVSNFYQKASNPIDKKWPMAKGTVHPASMENIMQELRVHPSELTEAHILPFIPKGAEINQKEDKRYTSFMKVLAETASIQAAATYIMDTTDWDFMGVYFDGIDHFSHGFMKYHPPRLSHISEKDFEMYKDVINGAYIFHDMMLDSMLSMIDEDTTVILVSDHGFHSDHLRPTSLPKEAAGPAYEHRKYGVFCAMGPGIKKDELVYGTSLLDVTPTILNIFDLPLGEDMDGKVQTQIFETPKKIEIIPSWEKVEGFCGMHPNDLQQDPIEAKAALDQLVELGYIDEPDKNGEIAQKKSVKELNYNLSRVHIGTDRYEKALEILIELIKDYPNETRFLLRISQSYQKIKKYKDAHQFITRTRKAVVYNHKQEISDVKNKKEELENELKKFKIDSSEQKKIAKKIKEKVKRLETLEQNKPTDFPSLDLAEASILIDQDQPKKALEILTKMKSMSNLTSQRYVYLGRCFLLIKNFKDAEQEFRKAIKIDSDSLGATHGLAVSLLRQKKFYDSIDVSLVAVALSDNFAIPHFHLGEALYRVNEYESAVHAFNMTLSINPHVGQARNFLIKIFENHPELAKNNSLLSKKDNFNVDQVITEQKVLIKKEALSEIVVVSGLPRSGTSMMMQMIVAGGIDPFTDNERKPDDSNPKGYYEHQEIKKLGKDVAILKNVKNKVVKIISHLLIHLPARYSYKIIFMIRDIDEVVQSQHIMLEKNKKIKPKTYLSAIKENYKNDFKKVENWKSRNHNVDILYVSYSSVIDNPKKTAKKINSFLNKELNVNEMIKVVDKALYRNKNK